MAQNQTKKFNLKPITQKPTKMEEKLLKYPSSPFGVGWDTLLIGAEDVWGIIIVPQGPVSV